MLLKWRQKEDINGSSGSGVAGGLYGGAGLYSQGRGMDSDSEDECCQMCGQGLFIDKKFSIRDVYNGAKSIPKQVNKNIRSLKSGKKPEDDIEGGMIGKYMRKPTPEESGVRAPMPMGGRLVKGSAEMKAKMAKLTAMRKKRK